MNELPEQKSLEAVSGALRSFNEFINGSSRINSDEPDSISSRKQVVPILNPSFRKLNTFSVQRNYPKSSKMSHRLRRLYNLLSNFWYHVKIASFTFDDNVTMFWT